jgi:hypothetical protein
MTREEFLTLFKLAQEIAFHADGRKGSKNCLNEISRQIMNMVEDHIGQIRLED